MPRSKANLSKKKVHLRKTHGGGPRVVFRLSMLVLIFRTMVFAINRLKAYYPTTVLICKKLVQKLNLDFYNPFEYDKEHENMKRMLDKSSLILNIIDWLRNILGKISLCNNCIAKRLFLTRLCLFYSKAFAQYQHAAIVTILLIVSAFLLYKVTVKIYSPNIAFFSAAFFVMCPVNILFNENIKLHVIMILFLLACNAKINENSNEVLFFTVLNLFVDKKCIILAPILPIAQLVILTGLFSSISVQMLASQTTNLRGLVKGLLCSYCSRLIKGSSLCTVLFNIPIVVLFIMMLMFNSPGQKGAIHRRLKRVFFAGLIAMLLNLDNNFAFIFLALNPLTYWNLSESVMNIRRGCLSTAIVLYYLLLMLFNGAASQIKN
ncbi:hypothetical protein ENBRE01_0935 [Enteropsectra breve]|nr:hypothetical protein ENBRE01_0935 [Enteropsectra breve]